MNECLFAHRGVNFTNDHCGAAANKSSSSNFLFMDGFYTTFAMTAFLFLHVF